MQFKSPVPELRAYALSHLQAIKNKQAQLSEPGAEQKHPRAACNPGCGRTALQRSLRVTGSRYCPRDQTASGAKCLKGKVGKCQPFHTHALP